MHIVLVGVNHKTAPVEFRERLAFRPEQLPSVYAKLRDELGVAEILILSTCNRVEVYAGAEQPEAAFGRMAGFLSRHGQVDDRRLHESLYRYADPRSVEHLFAVASGLDSMVLGETDILYQVKRSYELARRHGATGKALNALFQRALNAGKAVRERTAIGEGCVSVGTVAVELAQKIFGDLRPYTALLVGAGNIGELVLCRLTDRGAGQIVIANRSIERARLLAAQHGGRAIELAALPEALLEADIVVASTAAPEPLFPRDILACVMAKRRHRPLCLIDLGVPRNVEPSAGGLENVYLFNVDDLGGLVARHQAQRLEAAAESEAIVQQKVGHFLHWWQQARSACAGWSSEPAAAP